MNAGEYGTMFVDDGAGMLRCVLCGWQLAWRYAQARVSHGRKHVREGRATEHPQYVGPNRFDLLETPLGAAPHAGEPNR